MSTATEGAPGAAAPDPTLMDPAIARDGTLWSPLVGRTSMTRIESAAAAVPELTSAILATADDLRICSRGLGDEAQVQLGTLMVTARQAAREVANALGESTTGL